MTIVSSFHGQTAIEKEGGTDKIIRIASGSVSYLMDYMNHLMK